MISRTRQFSNKYNNLNYGNVCYDGAKMSYYVTIIIRIPQSELTFQKSFQIRNCSRSCEVLRLTCYTGHRMNTTDIYRQINSFHQILHVHHMPGRVDNRDLLLITLMAPTAIKKMAVTRRVTANTKFTKS